VVRSQEVLPVASYEENDKVEIREIAARKHSESIQDNCLPSADLLAICTIFARSWQQAVLEQETTTPE
jgi:hypothetical protein